MPWPLFFLLAISLVLFKHSILLIAKGHWVVVYRLGKYLGVRGTGLHFIVPFVDRYVGVDLEEIVPNWRHLSREQIDQAVLVALDRVSS